MRPSAVTCDVTDVHSVVAFRSRDEHNLIRSNVSGMVTCLSHTDSEICSKCQVCTVPLHIEASLVYEFTHRGRNYVSV